MALTKNEVNILDRMADLFGLHNVAIGGGYARDTYFGEQPKDIDVVLCMQHDSCPEELVAKLCGVFEANGYSYKNCHTRYDKSEHSDFEDRLALVVQFEPDTEFDLPIDVLVASSNYTDVKTYIAANNFSLNQFMIPSSIYSWRTLDVFTPKYVGKPEEFGMLWPHPTSKSSPACTIKNVHKAQKVGWGIPEELRWAL